MLFAQPLLTSLAPRTLAATRARTATRPLTTTAKNRAPKKASTAQALPTFGPRRYDRLPGAPRNITETFTITGAPATAYTVRIQNGATDGSNRASGATIELNGAVVSTARTINLNTAALDVPATLATSNTIIARVSGAPGSYVTVTILPRPVITALIPASGNPGATVMITGEGFDPAAPNHNVVNFTRTGGGVTFAQVTSFSANSLTVIVPADAATGPVTVQNDGGTATSPMPFTVVSGPFISDFNPKRGPINTQVTITGLSLKPGAPNPSVTFTGTGNTRVPATVTFATQTEVRANVPAGTITGPIQLSNSLGSFTTIPVYSVETPQDFQITLAPSTTTALQGGTATYIVSLTGNQPSFTQLGALSVTGLPGAITASFNPQQITSGATSTLTLVIPGNVGTGAYNFIVQAKAPINGADVTKTAGGSVNVQIVSQTTLSGRVLSTKREPIMGATVSIDGISVTTDAAGNFLLSGLAAGTDRPIMVDGRTANAPNRTYPVIAEPVTITAGQANVVPYTFYLPAIDTANEVTIVPTQMTNVTTPMAPGLMLTIPANAGLVNRDGTPVTRASLTTVEIDRTPAPLPPNVGTTIVFTAQPGGARPAPGMKMPVTYPNLGGANPGTRIELWNFNHDTVQWYIYGYGNVSADGRLIVPEPGVGLSDFSWHFPNLPSGGCPNCCKSCPCGESPKPVDLSSGLKIERTTDISFGGARGGLELTRIYTTNLTSSCATCTFGRGWTHNYVTRLTGTFTAGGAGRIVYPDDTIGQLFSYSRTDPDNALVFTTTATPHQLGDVIRKLTNGTLEYRKKNGDVMRFDSSGRLTAMVDRNGNTTTLEYTGANLTRITDPVNRSITLQYGGNLITRATDPFGRSWTYTYAASQIATVTDPLGKSLTYGYDGNLGLVSVTDKRGNVIKQITYDGSGRVIEQKFAEGDFERYSYTLSGNMVTSATVTNALGRTKSLRFNGASQVVGTTDELGQSAEIKRDLTTNVALERKGPCGCREDQQTYDSNGNPITVTDRLNQTTQYEYDPVFNNVTRITDRLGRVTTYTYDSRGNRTAMTNALNQTTMYGYDQFGQLISITDALGHTSQMEYDVRGNVIASIDALGNRRTMEYDLVGRLRAINDPLGRRTSMTYDTLNRPLTVADPSNAITTYEYDPNGNQTRMTDALNRSWTSSYDSKNRLISSTDPLNRVTKTTYNTVDEKIAAISPSGRTTSYTYDSRGLLVAMKDGLGNMVGFTYDNRRNMTALIDHRGYTTTFGYDELFRVTSRRDPLGNIIAIQYDFEGNLIAMVDRLGRRTAISYDALHRRERVDYVDATVAYTYDSAGRQTRVDDTQSDAIIWSYDNANRKLSETTQQGTVTYTYNNASQRNSMTVIGRQPIVYSYDVAGRLGSIAQGAEIFNYNYDAISRIVRLERPNGVRTEYEYDLANKLSRLTHKNSVGVALEDLQYNYNADNEINSMATMAFAALLPSPRNISTANPANFITQVGAKSYQFNSEGQTIVKISAQGATRHEWDARGRLVRVVLPDNQVINYAYDALGRRARRIMGASTTEYVYDHMDAVLDREDGSVITEYINGIEIDNKLRKATPGGEKLYYLQDHLNSTILLTNTTGAIVGNFLYEVFGEGAANAQVRHDYTGREREAVTELMYYRERWYDPYQGRFISNDPIGFKGGDTNLFRYVSNDPTNLTDPLGLAVELCSGPIDIPALRYILLHYWIRTSTMEAGLGAEGGGIPGEEYKCSDSIPYYTQTAVNSHTGRGSKSGVVCIPQKCVDEACVNKELSPRPNGLWTASNQCHSFAMGVLEKCRDKKCCDPSQGPPPVPGPAPTP